VSGFIFGLNQSNKLFFEYRNNGFNKIHTFEHDIPKRVSAIIGISENDFVNIGFYDYEDDQFKNQVFPLPNYNQSDTWYLGGLYSNTGTNHTGFRGELNNFTLFSGYLDSGSNTNCVECLFFTGLQDATLAVSYDIIKTTGYNFNLISGSGITGYQFVQYEVPHPTGGMTSVMISSGLSGVFSTIEQVTPLTGSVGSGTYNVTGDSQKFDYALKSQYGAKSLVFLDPIESGDLIEVYSYQRPQKYLNINSSNYSLNKSGQTGAVLFHNGILNNEGVDFNVLADNTFTGDVLQGYDPTDLFSYNLISERIIVTPFSGLWSGSKILLNSGSSGTGAAYYPSTSQYLESGTDILITGLSGINLTGYDLFFNGQKMAEDHDYEVAYSGATPLLKVYGTHLPSFTADVVYTGSNFVSGWPAYPPLGISNVEQGTMTFIQKTTGTTVNRYVNYNTGADIKSVNITGFSEQVWLNGVKQVGYDRTFACDPVSGSFDFVNNPYLFYNNSNKYFNIE
jgi:hypothetical protein